MKRLWIPTVLAGCAAVTLALAATALDAAPQQKAEKAQKKQAAAQPKAKKRQAAAINPDAEYPPKLPGGQTVVTDSSPEFLKPPETLKPGVAVAKTPVTVDFTYLPGQDYVGNPWSNWGDSVFAKGKYYAAMGDHLSVDSRAAAQHGGGSGRIYEYDPKTKQARLLADTSKIVNMPEGHYRPGKVHTQLGLGSDGWIYFATHRGSSNATSDKYHYEGDWILRANPETGASEVVARAPVPKHAIPTGMLDPDRLIFYASTAAGVDAADKGIQFFAYDLKNRKLLYSGPDGPARSMMLSRTTGRLYYVPGAVEGSLMRFDPAVGKPVPIEAAVGIRAATEETPQGKIYTVSLGQGSNVSEIYEFDVKTEQAKKLGEAAAGENKYVASIDVDPTGRYLYYIPGAHGGSEKDNSAVVQYDVKTNSKKVVAFLHPFYEEKYGLILKGTYATSLDPTGSTLYVCWNVSRGSRVWDSCGVTAIHIPESERRP